MRKSHIFAGVTGAMLITGSSTISANAATPATDADTAAVFAVFGDLKARTGEGVSLESLRRLGVDAATIDQLLGGDVTHSAANPAPPRKESRASAAASKDRYTVLETWKDRGGRTVVLRRGYYHRSSDSGFGWWKAVRKHNLNKAAIRAGTKYAKTRYHQSGTKYMYEMPVNKVKCDGWGPFRKCKVIDRRTLKTPVDTRIPRGRKVQFGVITSYCANEFWKCPNWVKEAINI